VIADRPVFHHHQRSISKNYVGQSDRQVALGFLRPRGYPLMAAIAHTTMELGAGSMAVDRCSDLAMSGLLPRQRVTELVLKGLLPSAWYSFRSNIGRLKNRKRSPLIPMKLGLLCSRFSCNAASGDGAGAQGNACSSTPSRRPRVNQGDGASA